MIIVAKVLHVSIARRFQMSTITHFIPLLILFGCLSCSNLPAMEQTAKVKTEPTTLDHRAGFLGKMSTSHMQSLQTACMKSQNNQAKCDEVLMKDCSVEMSKLECQKMMAEAKAEE